MFLSIYLFVRLSFYLFFTYLKINLFFKHSVNKDRYIKYRQDVKSNTIIKIIYSFKIFSFIELSFSYYPLLVLFILLYSPFLIIIILILIIIILIINLDFICFIFFYSNKQFLKLYKNVFFEFSLPYSTIFTN